MRSLRLALGYFVVFRLQRVLVPLGAALAGIDILILLVSGQGGSLIGVGFALAVAPVVFFTAATFREISIRQTTSLAPHARVTLLASLLIVVGLVMGGWHGLRLAGIVGGHIEVNLATSVVLPFTAVSAVLLGIIVASTSPMAVVVVSAFYGGLFYWFRQGAAVTLIDSGIDPVVFGGVTALLGWLAFGYAYLATRRPGGVLDAIEPTPRWRDSSTLKDVLEITPVSSVAASLSGMPVLNPSQRVKAAAIGFSLVAGAAWLFSRFVPLMVTTGPMVSMLLAVGAAAAQDSRRARRLWLVCGDSREDIFRMCERRSLRRLGNLSVAAAIVVLVWMPESLGPAGLSWMAVLTVTGFFTTTYMGLMFVEGWRAPDVVLAIALAAGTIAVPVVVGRAAQEPWLPAGLAAALIAAGLICRWVAVRRWRRIDWTRLRPLRWLGPPSPRLRYGG